MTRALFQFDAERWVSAPRRLRRVALRCLWRDAGVGYEMIGEAGKVRAPYPKGRGLRDVVAGRVIGSGAFDVRCRAKRTWRSEAVGSD